MRYAHRLRFQAMFLLSSAQFQTPPVGSESPSSRHCPVSPYGIRQFAIVPHCTCTSVIQQHEMLLGGCSIRGGIPLLFSRNRYCNSTKGLLAMNYVSQWCSPFALGAECRDPHTLKLKSIRVSGISLEPQASRRNRVKVSARE